MVSWLAGWQTLTASKKEMRCTQRKLALDGCRQIHARERAKLHGQARCAGIAVRGEEGVRQCLPAASRSTVSRSGGRSGSVATAISAASALVIVLEVARKQSPAFLVCASILRWTAHRSKAGAGAAVPSRQLGRTRSVCREGRRQCCPWSRDRGGQPTRHGGSPAQNMGEPAHARRRAGEQGACVLACTKHVQALWCRLALILFCCLPLRL